MREQFMDETYEMVTMILDGLEEEVVRRDQIVTLEQIRDEIDRRLRDLYYVGEEVGHGGV